MSYQDPEEVGELADTPQFTEQDRYANTVEWKRGEVSVNADLWYAPTSAEEQAENGGYMRTSKPVGVPGDPAPLPIRGLQPDGDAAAESGSSGPT